MKQTVVKTNRRTAATKSEQIVCIDKVCDNLNRIDSMRNRIRTCGVLFLCPTNTVDSNGESLIEGIELSSSLSKRSGYHNYMGGTLLLVPVEFPDEDGLIYFEGTYFPPKSNTNTNEVAK